MIMNFMILRLRLWRRIRRHYLSMDELSMLNDLTLTEIRMVAETMKLAERFK